MPLSNEKILELAMRSLERFAFPSSNYDSAISYHKELEPLPTQKELEKSIEDIEVESEDNEGNPATGWLNHRDLSAWARDHSDRLYSYTQFEKSMQGLTCENFLGEFSEAVSLWKNYQPLAGTVIEIDSWWATAKDLGVASLARSKIIDLMSPSDAQEWLQGGPPLGEAWDDVWSVWEKMASNSRVEMATAWAEKVLLTNPESLRNVNLRQTPEDYRKLCINNFYGRLVAVQVQDLPLDKRKGAEAIESLLAPHSTLSLEQFPWHLVFEKRGTRESEWKSSVVSPEELQARVEFIVKRMHALVEDWKSSIKTYEAPMLSELRHFEKDGTLPVPKHDGIRGWLSSASKKGSISMEVLQKFLDRLDQSLGGEPNYRNAFDAGFLAARFDSRLTASTHGKPKPRL